MTSPHFSRLERMLGLLPPNPRVIDLGCGMGRDISYLASRGADVTGVEKSRLMVEGAKAELKTNELDGRVVYGDMRDPSVFDGEYDAVLTVNSMVMVPFSDIRDVTHNIHTHTRRGGAYLGNHFELTDVRQRIDAARTLSFYPHQLKYVLDKSLWDVLETEREPQIFEGVRIPGATTHKWLAQKQA